MALKVLRGEYFSDMQVRSRFIDEAQTCMRLVHPNIVRVIECAQTDDGAPYLVMELLEGVPLGAYMRGGARVPVAQAVPILQAILAGLAMAHANGVVHRDLKPDNVFLTREPGWPVRGQSARLRDREGHGRRGRDGQSHAHGHAARNSGVHEPRSKLETRETSTSALTSGARACCSTR